MIPESKYMQDSWQKGDAISIYNKLKHHNEIFVQLDELMGLTRSGIDVPVCSITLEPFVNPVKAVDGYTYERHAIEDHFDRCEKQNKPYTSPQTNKVLESPSLYIDYDMKKAMESARAMAATIFKTQTESRENEANRKQLGLDNDELKNTNKTLREELDTLKTHNETLSQQIQIVLQQNASIMAMQSETAADIEQIKKVMSESAERYGHLKYNASTIRQAYKKSNTLIKGFVSLGLLTTTLSTLLFALSELGAAELALLGTCATLGGPVAWWIVIGAGGLCVVVGGGYGLYRFINYKITQSATKELMDMANNIHKNFKDMANNIDQRYRQFCDLINKHFEPKLIFFADVIFYLTTSPIAKIWETIEQYRQQNVSVNEQVTFVVDFKNLEAERGDVRNTDAHKEIRHMLTHATIPESRHVDLESRVVPDNIIKSANVKINSAHTEGIEHHKDHVRGITAEVITHVAEAVEKNAEILVMQDVIKSTAFVARTYVENGVKGLEKLAQQNI